MGHASKIVGYMDGRLVVSVKKPNLNLAYTTMGTF
jgi:hypothetical protein